jgi:hypothetical protein
MPSRQVTVFIAFEYSPEASNLPGSSRAVDILGTANFRLTNTICCDQGNRFGGLTIDTGETPKAETLILLRQPAFA